ncbi:hypothetical protein DICVIV_00165 [Dictyocaulus viviparus]|uniref:Uncharacterized protein n=1 Tax=Dictyocaulus viviparus TaxID=29172 RepID=A0A0D8YGD1_DICVI|nr:hypothetical protein DICVIV_00165 [Dictyocaulus viviparus]
MLHISAFMCSYFLFIVYFDIVLVHYDHRKKPVRRHFTQQFIHPRMMFRLLNSLRFFDIMHLLLIYPQIRFDLHLDEDCIKEEYDVNILLIQIISVTLKPKSVLVFMIKGSRCETILFRVLRFYGGPLKGVIPHPLHAPVSRSKTLAWFLADDLLDKKSELFFSPTDFCFCFRICFKLVFYF